MTGLRIGELLALRWQDVDLQNGFLSVRQTVYEGHFDEPKTKRSKRTVPLPSECIGILAQLRPVAAQPSALVFSTAKGSPLCRRNLLNRQFKPVCKSLGLTGVTWHWLRHANATLHDARGTSLGTVQALLGHSSSEITRNTYIHSVPAEARKAAEEVAKLIGLKWTQVPSEPQSTSTLIH